MLFHTCGKRDDVTTVRMGSGMFRIPLLFSGLRRSVYLVRRGAGHRAVLTYHIRMQRRVFYLKTIQDRRIVSIKVEYENKLTGSQKVA